MTRIGILGGAFDPPHIGHLTGAEKVREEFGLDKIIFIPTYIPPHKNLPKASPDKRLEMVEIAIQGKPYFEVSDIEIKRKGISYTVDTIRELKQIYSKDELYLIIGMDEAKDFINWKKPKKLLKFCKFIILTRPGFQPEAAELLAHKKEEVPEPLRKTVQFLSLNLDISSTMIRELVKKSNSIKSFVPEGVENYIKENKLYSQKTNE